MLVLASLLDVHKAWAWVVIFGNGIAGLWALGVAALCAGRLITWLGARDVLTFFSPDGRLFDPMGYPNATAALPARAD